MGPCFVYGVSWVYKDSRLRSTKTAGPWLGLYVSAAFLRVGVVLIYRLGFERNRHRKQGKRTGSSGMKRNSHGREVHVAKHGRCLTDHP